LPYAGELPFALALLALVVIGTQQSTAFLQAFRSFARSAWSGALPLKQALPSLLQPLAVMLGVPALVALLCMLAQRAPTLRGAPDAGSANQRGRGRPSHGRVTHGWMTSVKVFVLGASLVTLVFDSLAGWLDTHARSASELLAISGRVLPAVLVRSAWVCMLLGGLELGVQYVARMRRLRMTRQQLEDEQRELAGDPRLLHERRSRAAQDLPVRVAPQLIAADAAQLSAAALLIAGTTCVVALEYSPEHGVPRIWLSAQGAHALELLARAYNLDLPIVSDELLASALFRLPLRAALPGAWHARVADLLVTRTREAL
jgi:type III secretion system FlhB-like substrate exporter